MLYHSTALVFIIELYRSIVYYYCILLIQNMKIYNNINNISTRYKEENEMFLDNYVNECNVFLVEYV